MSVIFYKRQEIINAAFEAVSIICIYGAFTFGGGYAMLPMFQRELVEKRGWLTEAEITEFFSVGQCLPGVIACNTAVFAGYKQKGLAGSIFAMIGVVVPSIVFILVIAAFFTRFAEIPVVSSAFTGLRVCVSVLILNTVVKLWKHSVVDKLAIVIFAVVFLVSILTNLPIALLVAAAGASGIAISSFRRARAVKGGGE